MVNNILVTGATGNIGSFLIPRLSETPKTLVRALVRDLDKSKPLSDSGVELVKGSFDDVQSLHNAMVGIDTVVLIAPAGPDCVTQNKAIVSAAVANKVRKVVRISAIKAAENGRTENTRLHGQCDKMLQESGMTFVILRPNYFMQNIFLSLESINASNEFTAGMGDGRFAMIDARDVADSANAAVTSSQFDNKIFEISGPASISFHDVADAVSKEAGRRVTFVPVSPDDAKAMLLSYGIDAWMAELVREYSVAFGDGWGDRVTDNVELLTGRRARSIKQFVREVLAPALV